MCPAHPQQLPPPLSSHHRRCREVADRDPPAMHVLQGPRDVEEDPSCALGVHAPLGPQQVRQLELRWGEHDDALLALVLHVQLRHDVRGAEELEERRLLGDSGRGGEADEDVPVGQQAASEGIGAEALCHSLSLSCSSLPPLPLHLLQPVSSHHQPLPLPRLPQPISVRPPPVPSLRCLQSQSCAQLQLSLALLPSLRLSHCISSRPPLNRHRSSLLLPPPPRRRHLRTLQPSLRCRLEHQPGLILSHTDLLLCPAHPPLQLPSLRMSSEHPLDVNGSSLLLPPLALPTSPVVA
mmetsp:Transcript_24014/g.53848  ORF Transcript_24014/g.53848 Transcript_24014/m.53848 type:complete len:294 (-) Transcript_24014:225-1106(-)